MKDLPAKLRRRREALGMSQRSLADAMGTCQSHVCEMENRNYLPKLTTLIAWSNALGFDVEVRLVDRPEVKP